MDYIIYHHNYSCETSTHTLFLFFLRLPTLYNPLDLRPARGGVYLFFSAVCRSDQFLDLHLSDRKKQRYAGAILFPRNYTLIAP